MRDLSDASLANRLATSAGALLMALRLAGTHADKALGDEGDRIANTSLMQDLWTWRRDDAVLSEEEKDSPARLASDRVWVIDPLDGTREFSEGRDDWAVHVALVIDGIASVGAVALPALGVTLDSESVQLPAARIGPPRMVVSRTRPPDMALAVAQQLGATLLPMGSAGAKAMAVVRGDADIYVHAGGQYEWDNAAPVAVATAAGLHCGRIDGSPLRYNNADAYVPDLVICRPEWRDRVLDAIQSA